MKKIKILKNSIKTTAVLVFGVSQISIAQSDPRQSFKGKLGKTEKETQTWKPESIKAPANAPNVVWILLDDVGFGASSAFGGLIETPTFDALASNGLKYTNFHTTGICAPTRAALLTGRNSHAVSMGSFTENAIETPGYNGRIPLEAGTVAEIFKENGYNTFALGKWHLTPVEDATAKGPFNRWPTGRGFERFYGFLGGETDQWHPQLWNGVEKIDIEPNSKHLTELLADKAINYIANQKSLSPEKPFFLYLAPGATHGPHQVAKEWSDKYKGKFDKGWDWYREEVFARQQKLGLLPAGTKLAKRNDDIVAWNTLTPQQKKVYARFFEVYAGFLSHTDHEIGRVVDYLKQINQLDNTIIVVVIGDNGASKEGTYNGTSLGLSAIFNASENLEEIEKNIDKIGTEYSSPNYPLGWALAANAPFHHWKSDAQTEGGTHNPLIISYPNGIKEKGGIRTQYGHVIDLLPTTVELTGVKIPEQINGYKQDEIQGVSLANSVNDAKAVSKHTQQYYEIFGNRSIYKDGWKAAASHSENKTADKDFAADKWELYNLNEDWTETNNLAAKNPEKLAELKALFESDALKYNVYPLKDSRSQSAFRFVSGALGKNSYVLYPGAGQLYAPGSPSLNFNSYSVTAVTEAAANGAEGVLLASGGRFGGVSLYVKSNKLHLSYTDGIKRIHLTSDKNIPTGKNELKFSYTAGSAASPDGQFQLFINGEKTAETAVKKSGPLLFVTYDEGLDVGKDSNTPVDDEQYKVPFDFTGKLQKVIIQGI
ncbi:arylsulfatase [Flavobacterium aquicola]|uniref:Arylsulfatase n=1 Tax=Flavobacterium aquicola TaxID=1682742 RepID=A0A3E0EQG5_9FLAO|nr:arylsulfatase [Flavobacterium aquicola]REH00485.1 arylsulfatase [Flavobacterium aquicola]